MVPKGINYNKTFRNQDITVVGQVVDEVRVTIARLTWIDVDQLPAVQRIHLGWTLWDVNWRHYREQETDCPQAWTQKFQRSSSQSWQARSSLWWVQRLMRSEGLGWVSSWIGVNNSMNEDVLYFEYIIYVTNNKLKWIEINCTMRTRPVLPVPKHIFSTKKGRKIWAWNHSGVCLNTFSNLCRYTQNRVNCMCRDTFSWLTGLLVTSSISSKYLSHLMSFSSGFHFEGTAAI